LLSWAGGLPKYCMAHHLMTAPRAATLCTEKKPCARSLVRGDRQAAA
jgi:hypothetical protein